MVNKNVLTKCRNLIGDVKGWEDCTRIFLIIFAIERNLSQPMWWFINITNSVYILSKIILGISSGLVLYDLDQTTGLCCDW